MNKQQRNEQTTTSPTMFPAALSLLAMHTLSCNPERMGQLAAEERLSAEVRAIGAPHPTAGMVHPWTTNLANPAPPTPRPAYRRHLCRPPPPFPRARSPPSLAQRVGPRVTRFEDRVVGG